MNLNATLFAQCLVFLVLAWFTMKFVWPPITKVLDERAAKITEGLQAAEKARLDLSVAKEEAELQLRQARESVMGLRSEADQMAAKVLEEARAESAALLAAAREQAEKDAQLIVQQATESLRQRVAELSVVGAERILRREIDARMHADLLANIKQEL